MIRSGVTGPRPGRIRGGMAVVRTGSFTQANARLSLVATGAHFSCNIDLSVYAGGKHLFLLYDSTGKALLAFTGAVGTGEALSGSELVDAFTNDATFPWETFTAGVGPLITSAINSASIGIARKVIGASLPGKLIKLVNAFTFTGSTPILSIGASGGASSLENFGANSTSYRTAGANNVELVYRTGGVTTASALTTFSAQQVTAPAATGFALRTASGLGGEQSVLSETSGFNRNDASGYTFVIFVL